MKPEVCDDNVDNPKIANKKQGKLMILVMPSGKMVIFKS